MGVFSAEGSVEREGKGTEEIVDSEVKGGFIKKDTLNEGWESISGCTIHKGPEGHSRNTQEIK